MDTPKAEAPKRDSHRPRPASEAYDELVRELGVRDRIYPDWVKSGKLARTDARDRYDRLKSAVLAFAEFVPGAVSTGSKEGGEDDALPF